MKQLLPLKIDLHVHTCYSKDATTTLKELIFYAKRHGLDGVAITDHNTVEGALKLKKTEEIIIIPGTEISTAKGHVLGLNLTRNIQNGLSPSETVKQIHDAGGIAIVAHPYVLLKSSLGSTILNGDAKMDAIEVINASAFPFSLSMRQSMNLASRAGLPMTAGSDSHIPETIGQAYTTINASSELEDIIYAIKKGDTIPHGKPTPWRLRVKKIWMKKGKEREEN